MAAEAARSLEYLNSLYYGSAAPALEPYEEPSTKPIETPYEQEIPETVVRERARTTQSTPVLSLFAVFGAVFTGVLMIFVMLAQVNYNEIAGEIVRLDNQLNELFEQGRTLEVEFENVIDMKEVERYARDSLGMAKPDADQVAIIRTISGDMAEIVIPESESRSISGFASFLSSLIEHFR